MNRRIPLFILAVLLSVPAWAADKFKPGTQPLVDGVYNPANVVVTGRQPLFSWEYACTVASFTLVVSDDNVFSPSGELWNYLGSTSIANSINNVTRVPFNTDNTASPASLPANARYYWQVTVYDAEDGTSDSQPGQFDAVASEVSMAREKMDLVVDWNNPFDPSKGQYTRFRFVSKDHDRILQVRVFTLSGELVREWPEQSVLMDAWYTVTWDGKNAQGDIVSRGMYLVNLLDVGDKKGVTKRIAVVK